MGGFEGWYGWWRRCGGRLRLLAGGWWRGGRRAARDEDDGRECERPQSGGVTMTQSASHDATPRTLRASRLETDAELAWRAGDQCTIGGRALWDETDLGTAAAR